MKSHRIFGPILLLLGGLLMGFISTGSLLQAPLILIFGSLGSIGAMALGLWVLAGRL